MTFTELLAAAITQLDRAGVPYMVTGSLASTYYGEPRATRDVDIVIDPSADGLVRLVQGFEAGGFYVDRDAALAALRDRRQFNAIGPAATKIDFMIRRDRPFSVEEFARRRPADLLGTPGFIATIEDTILAKLEWAAATESERQLRDIRGMLAVGGDTLDRAYLTRWIDVLDLRPLWDDVSAE